jgi:hypothetical protein
MGFAFGVIFLIFTLPLGLYIYWVTVVKPEQGRQSQDRIWKPLASRLNARWNPSTGGTRFHAMTVPMRDAVVTATVLPHAPVDAEIKHAVGLLDPGGWRTFVFADTAARGAAFQIQPRGWSGPGLPLGDAHLQQHHRIEPLLGTPPHAIAAKLTYELHRALATLGARYRYIASGPSFVAIELPGVCADPALLEAAIVAIGELAARPAYREAAS